MTNFISRLHTDLRFTRVSARGSYPAQRANPTKGLCKTYPRMEKIPLSAPQKIENGLTEVIAGRKSFCEGSEEGLIDLDTWSTLLGTALKERNNNGQRLYPSGGSLCPIETYVITRIQHKSLSVLHYQPKKHEFEYLWPVPPGFDLSTAAVLDEGVLFSSIIVFTSVWKRSSGKYGDFAYNLGLLEAGHMAQNVLLAATALGLQNRAVAGFQDEVLNDLLDIDTEDEQVVYSVILSKQ